MPIILVTAHLFQLCLYLFTLNRHDKQAFDAECTLSKRPGQRILDKGVILYPGGGSVDWIHGAHILITPPLTIDYEDIDLMVKAMDEAISEEFADETIWPIQLAG
jgi:adenosylmethionine-8-amino-7-oxononanoate aminotransferase